MLLMHSDIQAIRYGHSPSGLLKIAQGVTLTTARIPIHQSLFMLASHIAKDSLLCSVFKIDSSYFRGFKDLQFSTLGANRSDTVYGGMALLEATSYCVRLLKQV